MDSATKFQLSRDLTFTKGCCFCIFHLKSLVSLLKNLQNFAFFYYIDLLILLFYLNPSYRFIKVFISNSEDQIYIFFFKILLFWLKGYNFLFVCKDLFLCHLVQICHSVLFCDKTMFNHSMLYIIITMLLTFEKICLTM